MPYGDQPIQPDEILLRRILVARNFYNPALHPPLSGEAFHPGQQDTTGISLSRSKFLQHPADAVPPNGKPYFVAEISAAALAANNIPVRPDPLPDHPGHALLTGLNYTNRRSPQSQELKRFLAHVATLRVLGPFTRQAPSGQP